MTPEPSTPRRTLTEHVHAALLNQAHRLLARCPVEDRAELREALAQRYETIHERLSVELRAVVSRRGRADTRSTFAVVWLHTEPWGPAELCRARLRDLDDEQGRPLDGRAAGRDLLAQIRPIPDHVPAEWTGGSE